VIWGGARASATALPLISTIHQLAAGGATVNEASTVAQFNGMHDIGTQRMRTINVEDPDNIVDITAAGDPIINWNTPRMTQFFAFVKDNGFYPRVIIGQTLPNKLAYSSLANLRRYGPTSWDTYDKYLKAFLDHVTQDLGFQRTEWEVGNEMDVPQNNWVFFGPVAPASTQDMNGFNAYMTLYSHVSKVMRDYKASHPSLDIKLGGPATTSAGIVWPVDAENWAVQFVNRCSQDRTLICDFVSSHYYGNRSTGSTSVTGGDLKAQSFELNERLQHLQQLIASDQLPTKISISEWGTIAANDELMNLGPPAGAFAMDFITTLQQDGVDDAIFLLMPQGTVNKFIPALFYDAGTPTHAYQALKLLENLNGSPLPCSADVSTVRCIAAEDALRNIQVLAWDVDWQTQPMAHSRYDNPPNTPAQLTITRSTPPSSFAVQSVSVNSSSLSTAGFTTATSGSALTVTGLNPRLGDYASLWLAPVP